MQNNTDLFQKKALEKHRTPDRQDTMFSIVPSLGWGVLIAVAVVIVSILIWSFFGIMAEKVGGFGMILDTAGAVRISPVTGGQISKLFFKSGERIKKGEVVALISQPGTQQNMYLQMEQAYEVTSETALAEKAAELSSVREKLHTDMNVISPFDGIITNIRVHEGDIVNSGQAIIDVRRDRERNDIMAVVFMPALDGSKIEQGTKIQIMPGAIDTDEYGAIVGRVMEVSSFPVTSERIVYWTGNKEFADWVLQSNRGAVVEVLVELIKDSDSKSGYLWTSIDGPDKEIRAGMTCTAQAMVKREAPVVKAFKKLEQWIRSD